MGLQPCYEYFYGVEGLWEVRSIPLLTTLTSIYDFFKDGKHRVLEIRREISGWFTTDPESVSDYKMLDGGCTLELSEFIPEGVVGEARAVAGELFYVDDDGRRVVVLDSEAGRPRIRVDFYAMPNIQVSNQFLRDSSPAFDPQTEVVITMQGD